MPQSRANTLANTMTYAANVRKRAVLDDLDGDNLNNAGVGLISEVAIPAVRVGVIQDTKRRMRSHL